MENTSLKIRCSKAELNNFGLEEVFGYFSKFMKMNKMKGNLTQNKDIIPQFLNIIHINMKDDVG